MRAIVITRPGGPEVLESREVPMPEPGRGEVRVRVHATAVNRADLVQRAGHYPAPADCPADIPGLEYAGTIDALGEGVGDWAVGDRVFGLVGGGAYADHVVTHARTVARMPKNLSFVEAAAVPEAFITAYDALVTQGGMLAGENVLVHAVGSGVGTAAAQVIRALGARCLGTARSPEKLEKAMAFGMAEGIVPEEGKFAQQVLALTEGRGVDLVLDLVGGDYLPEDVACAASGARILVVGLVAGGKATLDLGAILRKRIQIRGTALRSRPLEEKIAVAQTFQRHLVPLVEQGLLRPVVDRVFPLAQAAEAQTFLAKNEGFGKLVLAVT